MTAWKSAAEQTGTPVRVFLAGAPGSGKTTAAATFPRPIFVFPKNEDSVKVLRGRAVPYTEVESMRDMISVLEELRAASLSGRIEQYGSTLVLDGMSEYTELVENDLSGAGGMNRHLWGKYRNHFRQIKDLAWSLPLHVVLCAWTKRVLNEDKRVVEHGVRMTGSTSEALPGACDAIGYCEQLPSTPPRWRVHFCTYDLFRGRTRLAGMPNAAVDSFDYLQHLAPYVG